MNKFVVDLNKLFVKSNNFHIIQVYDLFKKLNTNEWKDYIRVPEEGYLKTNLLLYNKFNYDLYLYSWSPRSICREKFDNMSIYKVLEGRLYHFENKYEGTVGVPNSVKYIDYSNFESLETNMISHSLHLYIKNQD